MGENRSNTNSPSVYTPNSTTRPDRYENEPVHKTPQHDTRIDLRDLTSPALHRRPPLNENEENSFHRTWHHTADVNNNNSSHSPTASFSPAASRKVHAVNRVDKPSEEEEPFRVDESV